MSILEALYTELIAIMVLNMFQKPWCEFYGLMLYVKRSQYCVRVSLSLRFSTRIGGCFCTAHPRVRIGDRAYACYNTVSARWNGRD
jgi:hypothetical protein